MCQSLCECVAQFHLIFHTFYWHQLLKCLYVGHDNSILLYWQLMVGQPLSTSMASKKLSNSSILACLCRKKSCASTSEVQSRIGQASTAFGSLKWSLWKKHKVTVKTKICIFQMLILPVLLYGSEMWTLLKTYQNKLELFQMRCLRRIPCASLRDRLQIRTIRLRYENQQTVEVVNQKCRLEWYDHIWMNDAYLTNY